LEQFHRAVFRGRIGKVEMTFRDLVDGDCKFTVEELKLTFRVERHWKEWRNRRSPFERTGSILLRRGVSGQQIPPDPCPVARTG
jgi:hypothetical protein